MNDEAIGALGAQSSVRRCRIDDVTLTYVVDGAMAMVPEVFFPAIPQEYWAEHPEGLDAQRRVPMSAGGLLVERGSHRLLIDAGLGSIVGSIVADSPLRQANSGAFIERLDRLGVAPRSARSPGRVPRWGDCYAHLKSGSGSPIRSRRSPV